MFTSLLIPHYSQLSYWTYCGKPIEATPGFLNKGFSGSCYNTFIARAIYYLGSYDRLLCIDQSITQEKIHQVQMRRHVSGQAETVLVWSGKESKSSALVRYLNKTAQKGGCPHCKDLLDHLGQLPSA